LNLPPAVCPPHPSLEYHRRCFPCPTFSARGDERSLQRGTLRPPGGTWACADERFPHPIARRPGHAAGESAGLEICVYPVPRPLRQPYFPSNPHTTLGFQGCHTRPTCPMMPAAHGSGTQYQPGHRGRIVSADRRAWGGRDIPARAVHFAAFDLHIALQAECGGPSDVPLLRAITTMR
jgi:hypothetical protein